MPKGNFKGNAQKIPRPSQCDGCHSRIKATDPLWYDRIYPIWRETRQMSRHGTMALVLRQHIPCFCSPGCRADHRDQIFAHARA